MKQNNIVVAIIIALVLIVVGAMFVVGRPVPSSPTNETLMTTPTPGESELDESLEDLDETEIDASLESGLDQLDSDASGF